MEEKERIKGIVRLLHKQETDLANERRRLIQHLRRMCTHGNYIEGYKHTALTLGCICICLDCGAKGYESTDGERVVFHGEPQRRVRVSQLKDYLNASLHARGE